MSPIDDMPSLVAVEATSSRRIILYHHNRNGRIAGMTVEIEPWLVTTATAPATPNGQVDERQLDGDFPLRTVRAFDSPSAWSQSVSSLRSHGVPVLSIGSRVDQYLTLSRSTLFRGMVFESLKRAQIDIETLGLDPSDPAAKIVIITAAINGQDVVAWNARRQSEPELIACLTEWIQRTNPEVIEGHNIFNFDLPFLASRASRHGIALNWGRDGSPVRLGSPQRFKAGARIVPYDPAYIHGRHIIDTYQQIQRYDVAGRLDSYSLKGAISQLGLERSGRTFVEGDEIAELWRSDPDRLEQYARDDVIDTNALSELTLPTEFYQTQVLPSTLQSVATGGPGEKVNSLMIRAYLTANHSIPLPDQPRPYPGGFSAVRATGVFAPVANADVQSLYPSIMLKERIRPVSDRLDVFLPMLETLTRQRIAAKNRFERASQADRGKWHGMQTSLKVLINSFYGYLGYSRGYFSDFEAAERVTLESHGIISLLEQNLIKSGSKVIEVDTDGIYFVPPDECSTDSAIEALVEHVGMNLGAGIHLAFGGHWKSMLSLKLKNYALLGYDGTLTIRGSALRSRREEPLVRDFIRSAVLGFLKVEGYPHPRETYFSTATAILEGSLPVEALARTETITERTFSSTANRRLARAVAGERVGERVRVYQRQGGELARIEEYADDEDRDFALQRLRSAAERFRPLYEDATAFEFEFPVITTATDLKVLSQRERTSQPRLF